MKSFLLEQLARLIVPLALLMGFALYLKGHDEPGGGFVGGLSLAVAGLLSVVAFGERKVLRWLNHLPPDRIAICGALTILASILLPALFGHPLLTNLHGVIPLFGALKIKWSTALLFDAGVVMIVGGGLTAASAWLWGTYGATRSSLREDAESDAPLEGPR